MYFFCHKPFKTNKIKGDSTNLIRGNEILFRSSNTFKGTDRELSLCSYMTYMRTNYISNGDPTKDMKHLLYSLSEDSNQLFVVGGKNESQMVRMHSFDFKAETWTKHFELEIEWGSSYMIEYKNIIWSFDCKQVGTEPLTRMSWYDLNKQTFGNFSMGAMQFSKNSFLGTFEHFWCQSNVKGIILQVSTKKLNGTAQSAISATDLDKLKIYSISESSKTHLTGYTWKTILTRGKKLFLLGHLLSIDGDKPYILSVDLSRCKHLWSKITQAPIQRGVELANDMLEFLNKAEFCDFEITGVEGNVRPPLIHKLINFQEEKLPEQSDENLPKKLDEDTEKLLDAQDATENSQGSLRGKNRKIEQSTYNEAVSVSQIVTEPDSTLPKTASITPNAEDTESTEIPQFCQSRPIKVHMFFLLARWPYFKRMMTSRGKEYHNLQLHIPEPISWVRKLIDYMYGDSITDCDIEEATGLLLLSDM